jgi:hypothetical protein
VKGVAVLSLSTAIARLPIVLVVDPVTESRFTIWRLLSVRFGVLEAADARGACRWLSQRPDIDALIVQSEHPEADGSALVRSLKTTGARIDERLVVMSRPAEVRRVVADLTRRFTPSLSSATRPQRRLGAWGTVGEA